MGVGEFYLNSRIASDLRPRASESGDRGLTPDVRGPALSLSKGPVVGLRPTSPTTKECNSRARKHFGSWKGRCYNRLTEKLFPYIEWISRARLLSRRGETWESRWSADYCKEDHLVRTIE